MSKTAEKQELEALEKNYPDFFIRNHRVRLEVVKKQLVLIARSNPEGAIALYETALNDNNAQVRRNAANALPAIAKSNPEGAIGLYEKALNDSDAQVRRNAAWVRVLRAIAKYKPEEATALYEIALKDEDEQVRYNAANAIHEIAKSNHEGAIGLYEKALNDSHAQVRMYTATALHAIAKSDPNAAEKLLNWIKSNECAYREEIIENNGYKKAVQICNAANQPTGQSLTLSLN